MKFQIINNTICRMVEPTPLTETATFPCMVRLIQDDSPMGRYNQSYSEDRHGVRLRCCLLPIIATHIAKNGVVNDIEWYVTRYEIIGYPVVDGSAEWALYQMMHGKWVINPSLEKHKSDKLDTRYFHAYSKFGQDVVVKNTITGADSILGAANISHWVNYAEPTGWQLYEPKPKPEPLLADAKVGDLCKLRNGAWTQIEHIFTICYPKRFRALNGWSYSIDGKAGDPAYNVNDDYDIIHTETLATKGTAEWAWQMLMLGIPVSHPAEGEFQDTCYTKEGFVRCIAKTGWQIYEPAFKVGDWVEIEVAGVISQERVRTGVFADSINAGGIEFYSNGLPVMRPLSSRIARKLSPSEVEVDFGSFRGWIKRASNYNIEVYSKNNCWVANIRYNMLDTPTRELVESLLKAQEEE